MTNNNYWIKLPSRVKQSEKNRYNHIISLMEMEDPRIAELDARVRALEDKAGYTVTVSEINKVSGATVKLNTDSFTDEGDGVYTLDNVVPGTYTLTVEASGYNDYSEEITVDYQHLNFEVELELTPESE